MKIGDRVGAILKADAERVHLLGYGVYRGRDIPPDEMMQELGIDNPKIQLDDGRVVWGYQCWWGPEEKVKDQIGGRVIVPAAIDG